MSNLNKFLTFFYQGKEVQIKNHYDLDDVLEKYLPDLTR